MHHLGLVAIGRNEGDRLEHCLRSTVHKVNAIVYVDSGSTDSSIERAKSLGVEVVKLDLSLPFTAARARNAGLDHLLQLHPNVEFVQFVDGDCEVIDGWLERAAQELADHSQLAVVCGRRRERFPQQSIYNQLCDMEWNTPVGEAKACGGDAMMRVKALQQVGGYNPSLIAGEEPELCVRLRQANWKIWRIDAEMTLHDAQMKQFSQWWYRAVRAGHAYAQGAWLHGEPPERHWVKECRSIWFWGLLVPLSTMISIPITHGWSLLMVLSYPLMVLKIYRHKFQENPKHKDALLYSVFCVLSKFPNMSGQLTFHVNRLRGHTNSLIEYKQAT